MNMNTILRLRLRGALSPYPYPYLYYSNIAQCRISHRTQCPFFCIELSMYLSFHVIMFSAFCWRQRRSYVSLLEGLPDGTYVFPEELEEIADIVLEEYTARDICSWLCDMSWHPPALVADLVRVKRRRT